MQSCNHCCSEKLTSITYSECVFVALVTQHAKRMCRIVIRDLCGSTIFFHNISLTERFSTEKNIEHKMCVLIFFTPFI